jgi:hypothetical protein
MAIQHKYRFRTNFLLIDVETNERGGKEILKIDIALIKDTDI